MARCLVALLLCLMAADLADAKVCTTKGLNIDYSGSGRLHPVMFPCSYIAMKEQSCGDYNVSLTPGNQWLGYENQLSDLRFRIYDSSGNYWEGITNNKRTVRYIKKVNEDLTLFWNSGGTLSADDIFSVTRDRRSVIVTADNGDFQLQFWPWYPELDNKDGRFHFVCNRDDFLNYWPDQLCGKREDGKVVDLWKNPPYNLRGSDEVGEHIFGQFLAFGRGNAVQHSDPKCKEAVDIMDSCGNITQKLEVMKLCEVLLRRDKAITRCITAFSCHPMDVYNVCLRWGCQEQFDKTGTYCEPTARPLDLCPEAKSGFGDLTAITRAAKCVKDFVQIE